MKEIIKQVANELQKDFSQFPFSYTSSEQEAQYRVFELLRSKYISGSIKINRSDSVPPFRDESSSRIRLGYGLTKYIHDIIIFKEGAKDPDCYDDVEAIIEIKSTWGQYRHLNNKGFLKDFKFVHNHPDIGFYLIFIGNNYENMNQYYQKYYHDSFYSLKKSNDYSFQTGQVYMIFRDKIFD